MKKILSLFLTGVVFVSTFSCLGTVASAGTSESKEIESIEFVPEEEYIFYEGIDGEYVTETDENGEEISYYKYDYASLKDGNKLNVYYTDGTVKSYVSCEDFGFDYVDNNERKAPYSVEIIDTQESNPWKAGKENYIVVKYGEYTTQVPVTVVGVKSVEFVPVEEYVFYDGLKDDYVIETDENGEEFGYYRYEYSIKTEGNKLYVDYTDGSQKIYTYYDGMGFVAPIEESPEYPINVIDTQLTNPWSPSAESNTFTIEYGGKTTQVPVSFITIDHIEFIPYKEYEVSDDSGEYVTETDENGEEISYYKYDYSINQDGNKLNVYYTDGTKKTYDCCEDFGFDYVDNNERKAPYSVEIIDTQATTPWKMGSDNYFIVKYGDCTTQVPVNVDGVGHIEFIPAEKYVFYEGSDDDYVTETDENGEEISYYKYDYSILKDGNKLRVYDGNGSQKTYKYYEDDRAFIAPIDESPKYRVNVIDTQATKPWSPSAEDNSFTVEYGGKTAKVSVDIVSIDHIEFIPYKEYEVAENSGEYVTGTDENGEEIRYYKYNYSINKNRNKLNIYYTDGTVKSYECDRDLGFDYVDAQENKASYPVEVIDTQATASWEPNKRNFFVVKYGNYTTEVEVKVKESGTTGGGYDDSDFDSGFDSGSDSYYDEVVDISFISAEDYILTENVDGEWIERENDEGDFVTVFNYLYEPWLENSIVLLTYESGVTEEYFCKTTGNNVFVKDNEEIELYFYDHQDSDPWSTDEDNYFYVSYKDLVAAVPVTIVSDDSDSSVVDVVFNLKNDFTFKEYTNGYFSFYIGIDNKLGEYRYDLDIYSPGNSVTVYYKDGSCYEYVYDEEHYEFWNDELRDFVNIDVKEDQDEGQWGVGVHEVMLTCCGKTTSIPVTIESNGIVDVTYTTYGNEPSTCTENNVGFFRECTFDECGCGEVFFVYEGMSFSNGDCITIKYDTGKKEKYYYTDGEWLSSDGEVLEYGIGFSSDQSSKHWGIGKDNYIIITVAQFEIKEPVEVKESPVESIVFTFAEAPALYENKTGYLSCDEIDDEYYEYFVYEYYNYLYIDGNKITLTYRDGEKEVYVYDEDTGYFENKSGDILNPSWLSFYDTQSYENQWTAGKNYFRIKYWGTICDVEVNVWCNDHKASGWITDKKATVYKAGSKHKECTKCGKVLKTATIKQKKCEKPSLKSIKNTDTGVKITWNKVKGADKYRVYRKVKGGEWKYIGSTTKAYYTDKTAKSGTKYYYAVKAQNEAGNSSLSGSLSKLYLADPTLKTPSSTKNGISLKWTKTKGAQGYVIYRKTGNGSYEKLKTVKGSAKTSYVDKKAKKGKKYTYKVKAYYSKTYSAYSNTKTIKDKY